MSEIQIYKQDAKPIMVREQDLGLYKGMIAQTCPETTLLPTLQWTGTAISHSEFRRMLAFLTWSYAEHKVEAQGRFFYNEWTGEWRAVVLPQYIWSAGHTREVEDDDPDEENIKLKDAVLEPLLQAGFDEAATIHHHSSGGAFQSGGDKTDELSRNGFHITVGHMAGKVADFHCRATLRKVLYDGSKGMIYPQQWLPGLHNGSLVGEYAKFWLDLENLPEFPQEWKDAMLKKPVVITKLSDWQKNNQQDFGYGYGRNYQTHHSSPRSTTTTKQSASRPYIYRQAMFAIQLRTYNGTGLDHLIKYIAPRTVASWNLMKEAGVTNLADYVEARAKTHPADPAKETVNNGTAERLRFNPKNNKLDLSCRIQLYLVATGGESITLEEVNFIGTLSDLEFGCYQSTLAAKAKENERTTVHLGTSFPGEGHSDMPLPDQQVAFIFACELANFRDDTIPNMMGAYDLEKFCSSLQRLTARFCGNLAAMSQEASKTLINAKTDEDFVRETMVEWMSRVLQILNDLEVSDLEVLFEACLDPSSKRIGVLEGFDFYKAMCSGLDYGQSNGHQFMNDYEEDGTLDVYSTDNYVGT